MGNAHLLGTLLHCTTAGITNYGLLHGFRKEPAQNIECMSKICVSQQPLLPTCQPRRGAAETHLGHLPARFSLTFQATHTCDI
ncbi:hypothetical protein B0T19DRAFT_179091 [Cercophora scortea]|uniref:Uncharacterized protein n=1 Tax=Cercophora scortea TaxID=314031 RepID=A0AAE0INF6_9PEZI|nr:hypothetical protein B0T19DRAFT_179091 [Cercophora scortea]